VAIRFVFTLGASVQAVAVGPAAASRWTTSGASAACGAAAASLSCAISVASTVPSLFSPAAGVIPAAGVALVLESGECGGKGLHGGLILLC
jgi:hypothetical protein